MKSLDRLAQSIPQGRCYHCHMAVYATQLGQQYTRQGAVYVTTCEWSPTSTHSVTR